MIVDKRQPNNFPLIIATVPSAAATRMGKSEQKPHAIFFAYPLQGHVIPAVHLATKLASYGVTITFVNTHFIHHEISKSHSGGSDDIFADARRRSDNLDIRYTTISDGLPVGWDRSLNHDQYMESLLHVFSAHVDEFVGKMVKESDPKVTMLIGDTFFVWASDIAKKYDLIHASFWTEPALVFSLYYHLDLLKEHGHYGRGSDNRRDTVDYIPGVGPYDPKDLMSYIQPTCPDQSTVCHRIIAKSFDQVKQADFILVNTAHDLEAQTLQALNQAQPTYSIGPIFPPGFDSPVPTSMWAEGDCTDWLDRKPDRSVLYVSFGSYAHASKEVIHEIAYGLLTSGVNFVWIIRPDIVSSDDPNPLPDRFEEKAGGRGVVLPWCRQMQVLKHRSIGGFLTHCGWNSILESTWCEIPLVCFPLLTDQFTNRKLVVDDWKIGVNLCDDATIVRQSEVAEKIQRVMGGKSATKLKAEVRKKKKILEEAWGEGGSSKRNFEEFLEKVKTSSP